MSTPFVFTRNHRSSYTDNVLYLAGEKTTQLKDWQVAWLTANDFGKPEGATGSVAPLQEVSTDQPVVKKRKPTKED